MKGSDSSFTTGSTNTLTAPRISETSSSGTILSCASAMPAVGPSNQMSSSSQAATATAAAVDSSQVTKRMRPP
jgi:hypothetical protein